MGTGICLFGKMGFGLLRVGITNTRLGMGNMSRNSAAYIVNNIPKLKERLKKYFQFRKSRKRNQRAALTTCSESQNVFFSALASQLFSCRMVLKGLRLSVRKLP